MDIKDMLEKCSALDICENRCCTDQYAELVFENRQKNKWDRLLEDSLGPAVKPAGIEPTAEYLESTKPYGGIFKDQVLYRKEFGDNIIMAMLWPWQDRIHTTLKLVLFNQ